MKYRKKPVEVEAVKWDGANLSEVMAFCGEAARVASRGGRAEIYIDTLEGTHHASVGDYIIRGVRGEFYPCKPDIFAKTYEVVEDAGFEI